MCPPVSLCTLISEVLAQGLVGDGLGAAQSGECINEFHMLMRTLTETRTVGFVLPPPAVPVVSPSTRLDFQCLIAHVHHALSFAYIKRKLKATLEWGKTGRLMHPYVCVCEGVAFVLSDVLLTVRIIFLSYMKYF